MRIEFVYSIFLNLRINNIVMKKITILLCLICFIFSSFSKEIRLTDSYNQFEITDNSTEEFSFVSSFANFTTKVIKTKEGDFVKIIVKGYSAENNFGKPELPVLKKLFSIPYGGEVVVKIINIQEQIISLNDYGIYLPIFPNQPSISKSENAEDVPFVFDRDFYQINAFNENPIVKTEVLGKMRGREMGRLSISPFSYNPVTNELKIITKIEVKVIFKNADYEMDLAIRKQYFNPNFEHQFKRFANYLPIPTKDLNTTYPIKYVIIADPMFQSILQPFVEWKIKKGFEVIEGYTDDPAVGNTITSIKAYIKNMYDNATVNNPAPTYLLLVGDEAQVPSFNGNAGSHLADMYYCEFDGGGDFYPEMYYGRFSATIPEQLTPQILKTLEYEQYTMPDPSYLDEVLMVAGVDASMAPTYGNGQINYGTDNYFNAAHSLTSYTYLYGSGSPITSDMPGASAAIIADVSGGVGFANYTAHCGSSGWSDPSFSTSDVPSLQNANEYGLMIGNCCQSNKFDVPECFGEALLRANSKGAVGYIGGSNNTYWDEDYWWGVGSGTTAWSGNPNAPPSTTTYQQTGLGSYDCIMHENGEQQADWFITQGQILHAGNLAVTQAGGAEQYYWEIYHLMGDPSVMPYIGVPSAMTVNHLSAVAVGTSTLVVTTEQHAYVALSMNGVLLDAQIVGQSGMITLSFSPLSNIGTADLVVTKQFREPYFGTVSVITTNAPFVICSNYLVDDSFGNNNGLVDYGEVIHLDVDLQNLGSVNATNVSVKLSTNNQYISITDSLDFSSGVNANQTTNIANAFTFEVDNNIPDQHQVQFQLDVTDASGNSWISNIQIVLNAPLLGHILFTINDVLSGNGNGKLDAGETVDIIVEVVNSGHADINNLLANLYSSSSYVSVTSAISNINNLNISQSTNAIFTISIDALTPLGTLAQFPFDFGNGTYNYNFTFSDVIGIIDEDYETGNFTNYAWTHNNFPWVIDSVQPYEGVFCSQSFNGLPDGEESELFISVNVLAAGDISFYFSVSSEEDFDFLKFKINGAKMSQWSGNMPWTLVTYPVGVGPNIFKWEYEKDGNWASGQDCAWIDYIVFPPIDLNALSVVENYADIKLFPNPTMGSFSITFKDSKQHDLRILDVNGKVLKSANSISKNWYFDISDYSSGTYIIEVLPEAITYQIVKQ